MKNSYPTAIKSVLAHEGGYTNHPADPGGPTNWGITIADARMYWKPTATAADVKAMPLSVAQDIYKKRYWDAQRCDELPAGLDYSVFDYGVNSGIGRSGKVLRRILGLSDATSAVTQEVLDAVAKRDAKALIVAMNDERLRFLRSLRTWPTFGGGWGRRVAEVKALSLQLADGKAKIQVTPTAGTETMAKAAPTVPITPIAGPAPASPDKSPSTTAKAAGTGGAVVVAGAGAAAASSGLSAPEILGIITGVSLLAIGAICIGYRFMKGHWPWNSTGDQSQGQSPLSPQPSAKSLELASVQLALSSADSPAMPSRKSSARSRPRKPSAKPSRKIRRPAKSSNSSKRSGARKSSVRRKSKSRN